MASESQGGEVDLQLGERIIFVSQPNSQADLYPLQKLRVWLLI